MATVSWFETLEGKLAICFALLLLVLAVLIARSNPKPHNDPIVEAKTNLTAQTYRESQSSNLAELPALTTIDVPQSQPPADTTTPVPATLGPTTSESAQKTPPASERKKHNFLLFWLP